MKEGLYRSDLRQGDRRRDCVWVEARGAGRRVAIVEGGILGGEREAQQQRGRFALNGSPLDGATFTY